MSPYGNPVGKWGKLGKVWGAPRTPVVSDLWPRLPKTASICGKKVLAWKKKNIPFELF